MVFNGLKGAQNAVYSYLSEVADLSQRISIGEIADYTFYSYNAVQDAIIILEENGYIKIKDKRLGWPHRFELCREDIGV